MDTVRQTGDDLAYLIACALHGKKPDAQHIGRMKLDALYALSKAQSLGSMTAMALLSSGALPEAEQARWKEMRDKAIRKNMLLDAERMQIFTYLEQEKIWHMALKGVVIKELYPAYGMRQMGDNDLLIDENGRERIERYMLARGYERHEGNGAHDSYIKKPVYNFEMHWTLIDPDGAQANAAEYYADVQRLLKQAEGQYGRTMSCEDQYVYIAMHAVKHIQYSGTGLRAAVDQYVCSRAWKDMDRAYVQAELEKLGIAAFERTLCGLAQKLFAESCEPQNAKLAQDEEQLFMHMLGSGTYGTLSNLLNNKMRHIEKEEAECGRNVRGKYLFDRLFPSMQKMKYRFPVLERAAWLLPVMYGYRMVRGVAVRGGKIVREVGIVLKKRQHKK